MNSSEARDAIQKALIAATKNESAALPMKGDLLELNMIDSLEGMVLLLEISTITGVEFPEEDPIEKGFFDVEQLVAYLVANGGA